jgi:hypothetical protein
MKLLDQYRRRISLGIWLEAHAFTSLSRTVDNGAPSLIPDVLQKAMYCVETTVR